MPFSEPSTRRARDQYDSSRLQIARRPLNATHVSVSIRAIRLGRLAQASRETIENQIQSELEFILAVAKAEHVSVVHVNL